MLRETHSTYPSYHPLQLSPFSIPISFKKGNTGAGSRGVSCAFLILLIEGLLSDSVVRENGRRERRQLKNDWRVNME